MGVVVVVAARDRIVTLGIASMLAVASVLASGPVDVFGAAISGNANSPCSLPLASATPVASPVVATPAMADATERLGGRLGGSFDSWLGRYGEGIAGSTDTTQVYLWKGCGPGSKATFANGLAVWISLWSHRPEDIAAGRAHEADDQNWTQADALTIARGLLPSDAVLDQPVTSDRGNIKINGTSTILGEDVGWDTYGIAGVSTTPGEFEILMTLDPDGKVYELDVALRGYTIG